MWWICSLERTKKWLSSKFQECNLLEYRKSLGMGYKSKWREKASFLKENILPIQESGQLKFIKNEGQLTKNVFNNIDVLFVDGHTENMMIPHIKYQGKTLVFMADLLPSVGHLPLPYVMGYDTRPLTTLKEKGAFLSFAEKNDYVLFLEHDSVNECCTLKNTEKGVRLDRSFDFNELFKNG